MQMLAGLKVIDFSKWLPGQYCGMLLGDYGADIIKIEDLTGDTTRTFTPIKEEGMSYWHLMLNRNKKGITLNVRTEAGQKILRQLLSEADVFLEGFRPGYLARFGLDYESIKKINPRLVYCSITGFGPDCHKPAHDLNVVGLAGLNFLDGAGTACVPEVQVSAVGSSLNALSSICVALYAREKTGLGQHLDVNLYATALSLQITGITSAWGCEETAAQPFGRTMHYYNIYRTKDGRYLTVGTIEPKFWRRFCQLIEREDLISRQYDFAHKKEIGAEIAAIIAGKTLAEWLDLIGDEEFCVTPVLSIDEALKSQLTEQEHLVVTREDDLGKLRYMTAPVKCSQIQPEIRMRAPRLGEHNKAVLQELGYTEEEIAALHKQGTI